jgi:hypothetical protein
VGGLKVPSQINIQKEIDHDVWQGMFTWYICVTRHVNKLALCNMSCFLLIQNFLSKFISEVVPPHVCK